MRVPVAAPPDRRRRSISAPSAGSPFSLGDHGNLCPLVSARVDCRGLFSEQPSSGAGRAKPAAANERPCCAVIAVAAQWVAAPVAHLGAPSLAATRERAEQSIVRGGGKCMPSLIELHAYVRTARKLYRGNTRIDFHDGLIIRCCAQILL